MNATTYTRHAETRTQQRGTRKGDIRLIQELGTPVDADTWLMRSRDVAREVASRKREIQMLERLRNRKVVIRDERLITACPSRPADQKHALRRGRKKGYL
ncbi:MAG: hypothetical protein OYM47_21050 [Gemmatimonadota bacterium]|nr:hypothetical protein [Gemmatimonadota bacterium]